MHPLKIGVMSSQRGRVTWLDTDAGGRIHYTAVFRWVEMAELALFRHLHPGFDAAAFPRKAVHATYHSSLLFEDDFEVQLRIESTGRTSVTFTWTINKGSALCVEGKHTAVHVDAQGTPTLLPEWLHTSPEAQEA